MQANFPQHIQWSVNDVPYARFTDFLDKKIPLTKFDYEIKVDKDIKAKSFREECIEAAKLLPDTKLAIPVSGGDSEIVARACKEAGKDAVIYYEDYPWADVHYSFCSQAVAHELGYEWIGLNADLKECQQRMNHYSVKLGSMSRGFLITLGMFDKIPKEQFIVGGLGELEKDGWIYRTTMENCIGEDWDKEITIPCPPTEIVWWLYADMQNRKGMYTFFNSTLPLIKSQATHKKLSYGKHNKGVCNTIALKKHDWPELIFEDKTDHFHPDDDFYKEIYDTMEQNMYTHYPRELFSLVKKGFCGFVNYTNLFDIQPKR